jgi:DNA polymerase III subunit epsilon
MFTRLSLRLRIFLFFALLALGGTVLTIAGLVLGYIRLGEAEALSSFVIAGLVASLAIIGLSLWIWVLFDENIARPVERLAADMRARAHADVSAGIDHAPARYLGDLAPAAAAVAANLTETRNAMALAAGRENAQLLRQKSRLEALLAEVPDGVLFCTPDHTIALYNGRAADILGHTEALGLNRPISHLLMPGPVMQAYHRLLDASDTDGADILCATTHGARLLEARIKLLFLEGQETKHPGYVLSLRDVSGDLKVHSERAHLLTRLLDGVEAALPVLPEPQKSTLTALVAEIGLRKSATDTQWWPMEAVPASDLAAALTARLERKDIALTTDLPARRLRCDGFALTRLLERLALGWSGLGADGLVLRVAALGDTAATLSLEAPGPVPDPAQLDDWLSDPLSPGFAAFSGHDVELTHGTRVTIGTGADARAALQLSVPLARSTAPDRPRAMEYDFDLLHADLPKELSDAALNQLNFVVFDTETTGLNPAVDEICQIAAVRVVNGRIRSGECFDMLINPGRKIPQASIDVHHVTNEMVADAPGVAETLTRFHRFANNAVLVAHNAPFDMAFLQRREAEIGRRFDQPILDTVLLSAILFGQSAEHTLDALCDRLAISIPEKDRHTAIGDAIGTADAFAKMIPMMQAAGLPTLGDTIAAFDQHARLIRHLN